MRSIILILLFIGCSVIKRPGGLRDSTIVTKDSIHTTTTADTIGRDSVIYRKRDVQITHSSDFYFRPVVWYILAFIVAITTFFIIRNNR
jgi:hypothetical protein